MDPIQRTVESFFYQLSNPELLLTTLSIYFLPTLLAITLHEAAHGYVAQLLGDNTAQMLGRVSLNPLKHADPKGTFLIPFLCYFLTAGQFVFGYAKPVPVNTRFLGNPKRDMGIVAFAGPASNFLQALIWYAIFLITKINHLDLSQEICWAGVLTNLSLMALNLFPLPPLDGGRIAISLLPIKLANLIAKVESKGFYILIALWFLGIIKLWILLLTLTSFDLIQLLTSSLNNLQ